MGPFFQKPLQFLHLFTSFRTPDMFTSQMKQTGYTMTPRVVRARTLTKPQEKSGPNPEPTQDGEGATRFNREVSKPDRGYDTMRRDVHPKKLISLRGTHTGPTVFKFLFVLSCLASLANAMKVIEDPQNAEPGLYYYVGQNLFTGQFRYPYTSCVKSTNGKWTTYFEVPKAPETLMDRLNRERREAEKTEDKKKKGKCRKRSSSYSLRNFWSKAQPPQEKEKGCLAPVTLETPPPAKFTKLMVQSAADIGTKTTLYLTELSRDEWKGMKTTEEAGWSLKYRKDFK